MMSLFRAGALPTSIKHCEHLKVLKLNKNKMSYLPTEIKKLRKLHQLNIKDNNIISIPIEIKDLQHLEELEMDGNLFLSAPSSIKDLPKIKEITINPSQTAALFCGGKDITSVLTVKDLSEDRIVLNKVPRAHALAGTDSMSSYLDRLDQRESLPSLNLTHMKLTFLPQEVFALTSLTVLDIKENEIEFLPETICWLSKLVHLDASVSAKKHCSARYFVVACIARNDFA
jgi:Leucine-rich repeat (LRR) protein